MNEYFGIDYVKKNEIGNITFMVEKMGVSFDVAVGALTFLNTNRYPIILEGEVLTYLSSEEFGRWLKLYEKPPNSYKSRERIEDMIMVVRI